VFADDPPASDGEYKSVECPACAWLRFINKSGKLLGEK
jgi:hypothetical protein